MENQLFETVKNKIKQLIKKDIQKNKVLQNGLKIPNIKYLWENSKKMGKVIINELIKYNLDTSIIRRNFYILCLRMACIMEGLDLRKGEKYAWKPKNGRRCKDVATKFEFKKKKRLTYPLALGDCMLWFPGMIRTTWYINILKSREYTCSFRRLIDELDRFQTMRDNRETIRLKRDEKKRIRQFWCAKLL